MRHPNRYLERNLDYLQKDIRAEIDVFMRVKAPLIWKGLLVTLQCKTGWPFPAAGPGHVAVRIQPGGKLFLLNGRNQVAGTWAEFRVDSD